MLSYGGGIVSDLSGSPSWSGSLVFKEQKLTSSRGEIPSSAASMFDLCCSARGFVVQVVSSCKWRRNVEERTIA